MPSGAAAAFVVSTLGLTNQSALYLKNDRSESSFESSSSLLR